MPTQPKTRPAEPAGVVPASTDVLVVGAGPTGLTLGVVLRSHGCNVMIVDKQAEGANTSRAAVVQARALEVLKPYGVSERLAANGIHAPRFVFRDRDKVLMPVYFDKLPTEFPYILSVSQAVTEAVLLKRFTELGGRVWRPHEVKSVKQDRAGVTATFTDGRQVRAKYLVGADGLHSVVRDQVGIKFPEGTDAATFSLADVKATGGVSKTEVTVYFSPAGQLVVAPLPDGTTRLVAHVEDPPENPDMAFAQRLLDERGPKRKRAVVHEVVWGSRFRIHHGVASSYVAGRVALAGDAAHVHPPAGGQGMNLGLSDAVALGEALAKVLAGGSPNLLEEYNTAQRSPAERVVSFTEGLTKIATAAGTLRGIRNVIITMLSPFIRNRVAWRLSQLAYRPK